MNPFDILKNHFNQCSDSEAEFKFNGIPYQGSWPNGQSMPLFLKDLIEEAEAAECDDTEEIDTLTEKLDARDEEIRRLEKELEEARA